MRPANIILDVSVDPPRAVLIDWGLSRLEGRIVAGAVLLLLQTLGSLHPEKATPVVQSLRLTSSLSPTCGEAPWPHAPGTMVADRVGMAQNKETPEAQHGCVGREKRRSALHRKSRTSLGVGPPLLRWCRAFVSIRARGLAKTTTVDKHY